MNGYGYGFTFKGAHSSEYGVFVRTLRNVTLPSVSQTRFSIPGRPGGIVFNGEPENKTLSFMLTLTGGIARRRLAARQVAGWLSGTGSLVMDYEPDLRYEVVGVVNNVVADIGAGFDTFGVAFECEPYQYGMKREYGGTSFFAENSGTAPADTIIRVSGAGAVGVTAGEQSFSLAGVSGTVILDGRRMAVYTPEMQTMAHIHSGGFISVPPGGVPVTVSGGGTVTAEYWEMWK